MTAEAVIQLLVAAIITVNTGIVLDHIKKDQAFKEQLIERLDNRYVQKVVCEKEHENVKEQFKLIDGRRGK